MRKTAFTGFVHGALSWLRAPKPRTKLLVGHGKIRCGQKKIDHAEGELDRAERLIATGQKMVGEAHDELSAPHGRLNGTNAAILLATFAFWAVVIAGAAWLLNGGL